MCTQRAASASVEEHRLGVSGQEALVKTAILVGLCIWAFRPRLTFVVSTALSNRDWAHALVAPVAVLLLVYRRRRQLAEGLTSGSVWGIVLLAGGFAVHAAAIWPVPFGYLQDISLVPVLAGAVLAAGGRHVLKRSAPMLLLIALSLPVGSRIYASLIIPVETRTLSAARLALDQLPGVQVALVGPDLSYTRGEVSGTIALGEARRGASLLWASVFIGVFVVFARIRPFWQVVLMAIAAGPIALFCNFLRAFTWGAATIYSHAPPLSSTPRNVSAVVSLLAAYGAFAVCCAALGRRVSEENSTRDVSGPQGLDARTEGVSQ